uniref:Uncharacterized protein n=1 Tax=Candidatus Kentrum sp. UNK TaxID=2126344 RepID=A0A451AJD5_9GAMM|nr:MAG: hypothetical protein BECKUNK1418G_GA0071005_10813 [Candidatus Kentron sp. UNK]VFK70972.1 MAG: hypothetical protein BECKUNK1418H_GA0071006_104521 [Candidatus Kentron sp. UNK]
MTRNTRILWPSITVFFAAAIVSTLLFFTMPDNTLPDLKDSILSLFIMRWGLVSFPDLPHFWPMQGSAFFSENFFGLGLILQFFRLFGFSDFKAYYGVLGVLFLINFIVPALYVRGWGAKIPTMLMIGFGSACFPYLLAYKAHPHNWPIAWLLVLGFEALRYAETGRFKFIRLMTVMGTLPLFSMYMAYFGILFLLMFFIMYPSIIRKVFIACRSSLPKSLFLVLVTVLYGSLATL